MLTSHNPLPIKVFDSHASLPQSQPRIRLTKRHDNSVEMRRLVLSIQGKLPNVVAAGPDLRALRLLLNLQLAEAALLKPYSSKPADTVPI